MKIHSFSRTNGNKSKCNFVVIQYKHNLNKKEIKRRVTFKLTKLSTVISLL